MSVEMVKGEREQHYQAQTMVMPCVYNTPIPGLLDRLPNLGTNHYHAAVTVPEKNGTIAITITLDHLIRKLTKCSSVPIYPLGV